MVDHTVPIRFRRASTLTLGRNNLLLLIEALWDPGLVVLSVWALAFYDEGRLSPPYLILSLILFSVTFPGSARLQLRGWPLVRNVLLNWITIAALLVFFGYASGYLELFDRQTLLVWLAAVPALQLLAHVVFRSAAPSLLHLQGHPKRVVIAGINAHSLALANEIQRSPYIATRILGFFDDRHDPRVMVAQEYTACGQLDELPKYVKQNHVDAIYLALPMATQPRILQLLDALADTTVSIYFVPDIFVTDLMQGHMDSVGEIPVIAVCETPFTGVNGLIKRASDVVLSLLILLLISPLMLAIALAVKLSSPGPVIFRQRRYGLNGDEILISKFRSMAVCEDGSHIEQAHKNDPRVTRIGAILRKTSLDELPQFFNVLQGSMSIVGPRPHAVAHNELYRKIIKGYMVRHKIKPGITGWAQINGCRGETDTVEKMEMRIAYDLAYLRHWSLWLDIYIIVRTVPVLFRDRHAY